MRSLPPPAGKLQASANNKMEAHASRIEIFQAASSDIPRCIDAYNEAMGTELGDGHVELCRQAWESSLESSLWSHFLMASIEGEFAGFILACAYADSPPIVQMLAVRPSFQRIGAGVALLGAGIQACQMSGGPMALAFVRTESPRSQGFYSSQGGVVLFKSPSVDFYGNAVFPVVFGMEQALE